MTHKYLESKKFIAFLLAETSWKGILILLLVTWKDDPNCFSVWSWTVALSIVLTAGFIEIGFIISQAALDKYVRVAAITTRGIALRPDAETTNTVT